MKTTEQLNQATNPALVRAFGAVRRMIVTLSSGVLWQLAGVRLPDGTTEARKAEVFGGIGFASRPSSSGKPEAIAIAVGDANTPVIVGLRDEKTRAAVAGALGLDETAMFNTVAIMLIKSDGTIEARSPGGTAVALATKADLDALASFVQAMTLPVSGATAGPPAPNTVPTPSGTSTFKAE